MMAHPFMPMTNEMIKKLSRDTKDSDRTIKSDELPAVFKTQQRKVILDLNPQHSETDQSDIRTDNRY